MISYVVPLWRKKFFKAVCKPVLNVQVRKYGAELITASHPTSIYAAMEIGRQKAKHEIVCYIHDDVELLDPDATPRIVKLLEESQAGVLGVVGSAYNCRKIPWWEAGRLIGAWVRTDRCNTKIMEICEPRQTIPWKGERPPKTFEFAQLLDGIIMADRTNIPWPEKEGWHGYDVDKCMLAHSEGYRVAVGDLLVCHHSPAKPVAVGEAWSRAAKPAWHALRQEWTMN